MNRQRPRGAWSRPWLALSAVAWLAACQGLAPLPWSDGSPQAGPGWRVVERLGEARYLAPGMAGWEEVAAGSMVPAGSQVATGIGGRLIIHHAANQLSAGTSSRFILPGWDAGESVRQTAGWLRYRINTSSPATFDIETPFLDLAVDDAVLDVTVGESETEVTVVSGRVRVKSLDGQRQIDLHAGYTGYASLQGDDPLTVRRGAGQRLEPVSPIVLPALHPHRPTGAAVAPHPPRSDAPAMAAFAGRDPADAGPSVQRAAHADAASAATTNTTAASPASLPAAALVPAAPGPTGPPVADARAQNPLPPAQDDPAEEFRRRFDALTEGLLDGLLPALPPGPRRDAR